MSMQQRETLDQMLRDGPLDLGGDVIEQRQLFAEMMSHIPLADDVITRDGLVGGIPMVQVHIRGAAPAGTVLYFHGGAYAIGNARLAVGLASDLARRSGARVVSVEYSLAPESPYPAALNDALSAYQGLLEEDVPPSDIILGGESAGGGLAIALAIAIRDAGLPTPAGIWVASPWVDLTLSGTSVTANAAADPSVTAEGLARRSRDYAGATSTSTPAISPVFADLTALPSTLIQVGGNEILLDDSLSLASHAAAAGVHVTLEVTPDVPHVFVSFAAMLDEADRAMTVAGRFIRTNLATPAE